MPSPESGTTSLLPRRLLLISAAIGIATFLVFLPSTENGFVSWDDDVYVTDNPRVQHPSAENLAWFFRHAYFRSYTPLTFASHMLDYAIWKDNPAGHHLQNVIIHSLNSCWMFWLVLMLTSMARSLKSGAGPGTHVLTTGSLDSSSILAATVGTLAFSLHPLRVESVAWVSDRKDLLSAFFLLPAFLAYLVASTRKNRRKQWLWLCISSLLFLPSVLAKTISATAPAVMILLDLLLISPHERKGRMREILLSKIPYVVTGAIAAAAAFTALPDQGLNLLVRDLSSAQKSLLPLYSITFYMGKLAWPVNLAAVYDVPPVSIMLVYSTLAVLVTALVTLLARMRNSIPLLAWLTYIIFISPTVLFLSTGIQPLADRYTYIATAPLFLAAAGGFTQLWTLLGRYRSSRILRGSLVSCSLALLLISSILTRHQIPVWKDSLSLWSHAIRVSPNVPAGYNSLGVALGNMGRGEEAMAFFNEALKLDGEYAVAWNNQGIVYKGTGAVASAVASFRKAALSNPAFPDPYIHLGEIAEQTGRRDSALSFYRRARAADPDSHQPYARLGSLFADLGKPDSALVALTTLLSLRPDDPQIYIEIARVCEMGGQSAKAIEALTQAALRGSAQAQSELARRGLGW